MTKEVAIYAQEATECRTRADKMTAEGYDEYDIRKQNELVRDAEQMVPDTRRRLDTAVLDLDTFLVRFFANSTVSATPRVTVPSFTQL